jgi:hypothetical protein
MTRRGVGRTVALGVLLVLGSSNAVGSTVELVAPRAGKAIAAVGRLSLASPAPKVFCKVGGIEPFARQHSVDLRYDDGHVESYVLDRAQSARLRGPYALRNVYGAAVAFAHVLPRHTTEAVVRHGVCVGAAFGIRAAGHGPVRSVVMNSAPRPGGLGAPTRVEVPCAP